MGFVTSGCAARGDTVFDDSSESEPEHEDERADDADAHAGGTAERIEGGEVRTLEQDVCHDEARRTAIAEVYRHLMTTIKSCRVMLLGHVEENDLWHSE